MNFKRRQKHPKGILPDSLALGMAAVIAAIAASTVQAEPTATNIATAVTIQAGADWIPLPYDPWIEPGSALDFSTVLPHHAPAGKFGRTIAVGDHFEFEGLPGVPQRFYGVNLCNTANLPSSPEAADRFVANITRIGYNALRIHHHERDLISEKGDWPPGHDDTSPAPAQMEKFHWLVAACVAHGVYLTTDLYVSRSYATYWRAVGIDRDGRIEDDGPFKVLCCFWEPAYSNLCAWTRNFLCHVNPHTGRSLAEEPALVSLALINEGNLGNWGAGFLRKTPGVAAVWQAWIAAKADNPAFANIPDSIPDDLYAADGSTPERRHAAAFAIFLAERETLFFERLKAFVRDACGCRAPLSSLSAWYFPAQYQVTRTHFDYVDEHFYVDHPKWLGRDWHLPSFSPNVNPVAGRDAGAQGIEWRRLMDKPFCVTEWNFCGPGRFRGVGGIATGALGALQGWDGMWRFAWSHGRDGIEKPGSTLDYFNLQGDPLGLAAERAALCLFLRRDLPELETSSPLDLDETALQDPRNGAPQLPGRGQSLALGWTRRVGTKVISHAEFAESAEPDAAGRTHAEFAEGAEPDAAGISHAESAEGAEPMSFATGVRINPITGTFLLDTPCTAGGFAESGTHEAGALRFTLHAEGAEPVAAGESHAEIAEDAEPGAAEKPHAEFAESAEAEAKETASRTSRDEDTPRTPRSPRDETIPRAVPATVWASSLDGAPLRVSSRILVTHLTDVQNNGIQYGDAARTILLDWGGLPHLAENGSALIELQLAGGAGAEPPSLAIYRLDTAGHRLAEIPASFDPATGRLRFTAHTDYDPEAATLFYEIVRKPTSPAP